MLGLRSLLTALTGAVLVGNASVPSFPPIDRDKLLITLQRSACYGSCPDYLVTVDGRGHVVFVTSPMAADEVTDLHRAFSRSNGVLVDGRHEDTIAADQVDRLVEQFRSASFFDLQDEYVGRVTDNPTFVLTIDTGNGIKRVVDYVGKSAGMPAVVTDLERAVDATAGTARWVDGGEGLVSWLDRASFDFASEKAALIAVEGASNDAADETLIGFIDRGLSLERKVPVGAGRSESVGEALMRGAISRGRTALFDELVGRGWLDRLKTGEAARLFAAQSGGCNPAFVETGARAGLAIDARGEDGNTALRNLAGNYACDNDQARLATARALLDRGADPNARNDAGESAIFEVEDPDLLDLLYARGADSSVRDNEGNSAVFSSWTDEIVLRHLQHGASAEGRYYDKRTLRQQMKERPMPQAEAWLAENGR